VLKELIESQPDLIVVDVKDSIESTVGYLHKNQEKIDLLFLDIQLADGQCFEIFNHVELTVPVVFCTAYDEYVLQAFKHNGVDYILKPFDDEEVFNAIEKIKRLKKSLSKGSLNSIQSLFHEKKGFQKSIIAHVGKKMIPIVIDNILLFHLENEAVNIYCADQKKYVVFKTMNEIESMLDDQHFFRINRQMVINRDAVKEIEPYFNRKIMVQATITIGPKIIVSRLKVTPFLNWLEQPS